MREGGALLSHNGKVVKGHQIASGLSSTGKDGLNATVVQQMPFFIKEGIPQIEQMFTGTVNVNLQGHTFDITSPTYTVTCEWHPGVKETFWFVPAILGHKDKRYEGYVYFPLPSEIQHRNKEVVELLMPKIDGLVYGDDVTIELPRDTITVYPL